LPDDERHKGWHGEFNIEQIVQLHYPNDEAMQIALLSLMRTAILEGGLDENGANTRYSPYEYGRYIPSRYPLPGGEYDDIWDKIIPIVTKASYERWKDRPPLPEDSPLRGWIMDDEDDSASRSEQKTIIPHKKPVRIKDDWTEIIIEAIKEHENQEGRTGTKAQI